MTLHAGQEHEALLGCVMRTGAWRLFPFLLIYSIGFATIFPVVPTLVANGFASQAAGHPVQCETYSPETQPLECKHAHVQAVAWNAWTSFVSSSVLSCLFAPVVGRLSDRVGRKPFLLAGVSLALAPMLVLLAFCWGWLAIEWYYPFTALGGMVSSFNMALMSIADLLHQAHRATSIGYLSACFSVGIIVGPLLGGFLSTNAAVYFCIAMITATLLWVALFFNETAPAVVAARRAATSAGTADAAGADAERGGELQEPLLGAAEAGGGPGPTCFAAPGIDLGLDFDPIPNIVPHSMHDHTLAASLSVRSNDSYGAASEGGARSPRAPQRAPAGHHGARPATPSSPLSRAPLLLSTEEEEALMMAAAPSFSTLADPRLQADGSHPVQVDVQAAHEIPNGGPTKRPSDFLIGLRVIQGSPWYRKLTLIWVVVSMTFEGAQDLLLQYLGMQLQFNVRDTARLLFIVALGGLAIKLCLMQTMVRRLGEQGVLVVGLTAYMLQELMLGAARSKAVAQAAVGVGSFACVCWPASVALQTKHIAPENLGAVQGALQGISALATGVGPVAFAALFAAFSMPERTGLPYAPQVVWYAAAALAAFATLLTSTLHWSEPGRLATAAGPVPAAAERKVGHDAVNGGNPLTLRKSRPGPQTGMALAEEHA